MKPSRSARRCVQSRVSRSSSKVYRVEQLEDRCLLTTILALTEQNALLRIDSAKPSTILATTPITGLQSGESVVGIDVRPVTAQLYGLSGSGRLYTIDPGTGAATLVAALTADPTDLTNPFTALSGTDFGIDFNPVADRLRVVSNAGQNLRIKPDSGLVTTDAPLFYTPGTPHGGPTPPAEAPFIVDIAYTNNMPGATSTTLYDLDSAGNDPTGIRHILVKQDPPNSGALTKVAPFGKEGAIPVGFDIAPSGTAFIAVDARGAVDRRFLLVEENLVADPSASHDTSHGPIGDGTIAIRDIAVVPSVQFSTLQYAVNEDAGTATITVTRTEGTVGIVTVQFAAEGFSAQPGAATAGSDFIATTGTLTFGPTETSKTFTVAITNDSKAEGDEFIALRLSNPTGGVVLGAPRTSVLRINANDRRDRTGPTILQVLETGPSRGITGFRVGFDEDMNPARVQDVRNYSLFGIGTRGRSTRISLASAVYDPVDRSVLLTAGEPFVQTQFKQLQFRFAGGRARGITDVSGNPLRGPTVFQFAVFSGKTVTFTDRDGDRATITIANGGSIDGIRPLGGVRSQNTQFWILDPIALRSILSGTVAKGRRSNGIIVISEIIGLDKKEFTPLLSNTAFRVNTLTFSTNATGTGVNGIIAILIG